MVSMNRGADHHLVTRGINLNQQFTITELNLDADPGKGREELAMRGECGDRVSIERTDIYDSAFLNSMRDLRQFTITSGRGSEQATYVTTEMPLHRENITGEKDRLLACIGNARLGEGIQPADVKKMMSELRGHVGGAYRMPEAE